MCEDILNQQLKLLKEYNQNDKKNIFNKFESEAKEIFYLKNEKCKICQKILCKTNKCDFVLPKLICFDQIICEYEHGKDSLNNITSFLAKNRIKKKRDDLYKFNTNDNNIVIILESPHVDEFRHIIGCKDGFRIGMPCMGKTGENLKEYFIDVLNNKENADEFKKELQNDKNKKFNIIVMNAIQFQCSLGLKLGKKKDEYSKEKDELCKKLIKYDEFQKNIINRLRVYKPRYILNCSTDAIGEDITNIVIEDLEKNIDKYGSKGKSIVYIRGTHPFRWIFEGETPKLNKDFFKFSPREKNTVRYFFVISFLCYIIKYIIWKNDTRLK